LYSTRSRPSNGPSRGRRGPTRSGPEGRQEVAPIVRSGITRSSGIAKVRRTDTKRRGPRVPALRASAQICSRQPRPDGRGYFLSALWA
jgi:hypothetical protein